MRRVQAPRVADDEISNLGVHIDRARRVLEHVGLVCEELFAVVVPAVVAVVLVLRRALNGLVAVWLYFADVISDVRTARMHRPYAPSPRA